MFKRHEGHGEESSHYANVPFGYYTLLLSILYISVLYILRRQKINLSVVKHLPVFLGITTIELFLLSFSHWTMFIKRLGRISYALTCINLFLTMRPSPLPDYYYLELLPLHKWISRYIVLLALVHGILFLQHWKALENVSVIERILKIQNLYGVIVWGFMALLGLINWGKIRKSMYQFFYTVHMLTAWTMVILISVHARPHVFLYVVIDLVLLGFQLYTYIKHSVTVEIVEKDGETSLKHISIKRDSLPATWMPGSHVRVSSFRKKNPLYWFRSTHPFTLASLDSEDQVDLIVREIGDFKFETGLAYTVTTTPYQGLPTDFYSDTSNVILIAGGSGISFTLPLYKHFMAQSVPCRMIWLVKDRYDLRALDKINVPVGEFDVHITKAHDDLEFELETVDGVRCNGVSKVHFGRIQLPELEVTHDTRVVCCGPEGLIKDTKTWAEKENLGFFSELYEI